MKNIEKLRKTLKIISTGFTIAILGVFMIFAYFSIKQDNQNPYISFIIFGGIIVLFLVLIFISGPMQEKLIRTVIIESIGGLVSDVKFNKKKGYTKESFDNLAFTNKPYQTYSCFDYYSFVYKNLEIESTTIRAYTEITIAKKKGVKKSKRHKEYNNSFFGRIYYIPLALNDEFAIYGIKSLNDSRVKDMKDSSSPNLLQLKIKKYDENYQIFYGDNKPSINMQLLIEKLYYLGLQAKGNVSLIVRKNHMILAINNNRRYEEVDLEKKFDESKLKDYRKDLNMVLTFIDSLNKSFIEK